MVSNATQPNARLKIVWWTVVVVVAAMFLVRAGGHNFLDPDEGRYAEIPREMIESGDWITPKLDYVDYFEKPPLFYWMVAASMAAFGENEAAARLVVGLVGLATVLVIMALGTRMLNRRAGILAGWIYATALVPFGLARLLTLDGSLSLFLTCTWAAWYLAYSSSSERARHGWITVSWVSMALATLVKGPVAIVLSGLLIIAFTVLRRDWAAWKMTFWLPAIGAFAIVAVPWFVAVSLRNPPYAYFFFYVQNVERFLGEHPEHIKPFWWFFPILPMGMGAWALISIAGLVKGARDGWSQVLLGRGKKAVEAPPAEGETAPQGGAAPGAVLYLFLWVACEVLFFSGSACKLVTYILPAYPAFALLTAWYLERGGWNSRFVRGSMALMGIVLAAVAVMAPHFAEHQHDVPMSAMGGALLALRLGLAVGAVLLVASAWRPKWTAATAGLTLVAFLPGLLVAVPIIAKYRRVGVVVKALAPLPANVKVAEYDDYNQSLGFYLKRRTILFNNLNELAFGAGVDAEAYKARGEQDPWFQTGEANLKRVSDEGPLLVVVKQDDWAKMAKLRYLQPAAANSTSVFEGNATFFQETGLRAWSDQEVGEPPRLLMPRK